MLALILYSRKPLAVCSLRWYAIGKDEAEQGKDDVGDNTFDCAIVSASSKNAKMWAQQWSYM